MTYLACQWFVTIVVVRLSSGFDDAGLLSLAMSVVGIFSTFANFKMGTYQISDIKRENSLGEYMGFRCVTLVAAFVACMVYALFTCATYALVTIALFYAFKAIGLLIDILHGEDQVNRRMDYIGKSFMLQGVSTFVAFVIVYGVTCNLNIAIVAMFVAALLVLVLFDIPHCQRFTRVTVGLSAKKGAFFPSHIVACGCRIGRGECHLCHPQAIFSYGFRGCCIGYLCIRRRACVGYSNGSAVFVWSPFGYLSAFVFRW